MPGFRYIVGPWAWDGQRWLPPPGCIGGIDFGRTGSYKQGSPRDCGLFMLPAGLPVPEGYAVLLASGHAAEAKPGARDRDALRRVLGYKKLPEGSTLADYLWHFLTVQSDVTGDETARPLVPGRDLSLELHLPGHGRVKAEPFVWGKHPHTNRLRDLLRHDFKQTKEELAADAERVRKRGAHRLADALALHHRRVLGGHVRKYGLDPKEIDPDTSPLRPHTTITESFDQPDSTTIGPDLSWTDTSASTPAWETVSGQLRDAIDNNGTVNSVRADTALSISDLQASINIVAYTHDGADNVNILIGATVRHGSDATFYAYFLKEAALTLAQVNALSKVISGTETVLTFSTDSWTNGDTPSTQALGSTISGQSSTTGPLSTTDTSITNKFKCGVAGGGRLDPNTDFEFDTFIATDGSDNVDHQPDALFMGGPESSAAVFMLSDSATHRPSGVLLTGPCLLGSVDTGATHQPNGILTGSPRLTAHENVAYHQPTGVLLAGPRHGLVATQIAVHVPNGLVLAAPRESLVADFAVPHLPSGLFLAGGQGSLHANSLATHRPNTVLLFGHGVGLSRFAESNATHQPAALFVAGPQTLSVANGVASHRPGAVFLSGQQSGTGTVTVAATHKPNGAFLTGPTLATPAGQSVAHHPDGVVLAAPTFSGTTSSTATAHPGVLFVSGPRGAVVSNSTATHRPAAIFVAGGAGALASSSQTALEPGLVFVSGPQGVGAVTVSATHRPNGAMIAGPLVHPSLGAAATHQPNGEWIAGPQTVGVAASGVVHRPQPLLASSPKAAGSASAAAVLRPGAIWLASRAGSADTQATATHRPTGLFLASGRQATALSDLATHRPDVLWAAGRGGIPFATNASVWVPVTSTGILDPETLADSRIDQETRP